MEKNGTNIIIDPIKPIPEESENEINKNETNIIIDPI